MPSYCCSSSDFIQSHYTHYTTLHSSSQILHIIQVFNYRRLQEKSLRKHGRGCRHFDYVCDIVGHPCQNIITTQPFADLHYYAIFIYFTTVSPAVGSCGRRIKVPSAENTELNRFPFKAWSRSVYSHTCYAYCQ